MLSGVIAMVTCAVFLRLNSILKLAVLLLAVAIYSYLIHVAFLSLTRHDMLHRSVHSIQNIMMSSTQFKSIFYIFWYIILYSVLHITSFTAVQVSLCQEKRNLHPSHGHVYCCCILQWTAGTISHNAVILFYELKLSLYLSEILILIVAVIFFVS